MFNIGGGEFLVIALIALIVLGPTRLPGAARQVGKAMGELRRLSDGFQNEMKSAFDDADANKAPRRDVLGAGTVVDQTDAAAEPRSSRSTSARRREPLRAGGAGRPPGEGADAVAATEATERTDTAPTKVKGTTQGTASAKAEGGTRSTAAAETAKAVKAAERAAPRRASPAKATGATKAGRTTTPAKASKTTATTKAAKKRS